VAAAIAKTSGGFLEPNPHQDGYPDLLLMDEKGKPAWDALVDRMNEKDPFSPFIGGGIEVKATCGSVPTPKKCRDMEIQRPFIGDTRIECMVSYDWKAHHRETNNLVGVLWDFIDQRPRVASLFYSCKLNDDDWGKIVKPKEGGGRTTSVSVMSSPGIQKMYSGWLCVLKSGGYAEFLNKKNRDFKIPIRPLGT